MKPSDWLFIPVTLTLALSTLLGHARPSLTRTYRQNQDPLHWGSGDDEGRGAGSGYEIQEEAKAKTDYLYNYKVVKPAQAVPRASFLGLLKASSTTKFLTAEASPKPKGEIIIPNVEWLANEKQKPLEGAVDDLVQETSSPGNINSTGDKTLAMEIGSGDGKYALINLFFHANNDTKDPPGVLSYSQSRDFEQDNERTLGNLQVNDIWLSEEDLLVLKGEYNGSTSKEKWKPIDNFERTQPGLRIPLNTSNPPPFPVFVNKSGPPVFLGPPPPFPLLYPQSGSNETFDPSRFPTPGLVPFFPSGSIPDYFGPPHPGLSKNGNHSFPSFPFPPNQGRPSSPKGSNGSYTPMLPGYGNGQGPLPPFYPLLPPPPGFSQNFTGGPPFPFLFPPTFLNPADNVTNDPAKFLPPPYDFEYLEENSTIVSPGPFVPGLAVPPPPDFYFVFNRTSPVPAVTIPQRVESDRTFKIGRDLMLSPS